MGNDYLSKTLPHLTFNEWCVDNDIMYNYLTDEEDRKCKIQYMEFCEINGFYAVDKEPIEE